MGFKVTWTPDDATISSTLVLCDSTRVVAEHNVKLNHRSLGSASQSYRADNTTQFDRYNNQNTFSFEVQRSVNFSGTAFADAEAAVVFAALHLGGAMAVGTTAMHGTGTLTVELSGATTTATLTFANAVLQDADLIEWAGVVVAFRYNFLTGLITQV